MSGLLRKVIQLLPILLISVYALASPEQETKIIDLVGSGTAKIKRKIGTEIVAAKGDKLLPGDSLRTDASSTVDLGLADGSMLRVGPGSDYKVEEISKDKNGVWSWDFSLNSGSLRAVVEKTKRKDFVKFKTRTPTGTIGVRGTEFILRYSSDGLTKLFTTEGSVFIAPPGVAFTDKKRVRIVDRGFMSQINRGEQLPSEPRKFDPSELLSDSRVTNTIAPIANTGEQEPVAKRKAKAAIAAGKIDPLFYEVKGPKAMDSGTIPLDDEQMRQLIADGQKKMEAAQDAIAKSAQDVAKGIQASEEAANANPASLNSSNNKGFGEKEKSQSNLDVDSPFSKNKNDSKLVSEEKNIERCPEGFSKYDGKCVASPVAARGGKSVCPENSEMGSNGQCIYSNNSVVSNESGIRRNVNFGQTNSANNERTNLSAGRCSAVITGSSVICRGSGGASCSDSSCPGIESIRQSMAKNGYTPNAGLLFTNSGGSRTTQTETTTVREGSGLEVNTPARTTTQPVGVVGKELFNRGGYIKSPLPQPNPHYRSENHCQAGDGNDCYVPQGITFETFSGSDGGGSGTD